MFFTYVISFYYHRKYGEIDIIILIKVSRSWEDWVTFPKVHGWLMAKLTLTSGLTDFKPLALNHQATSLPQRKHWDPLRWHESMGHIIGRLEFVLISQWFTGPNYMQSPLASTVKDMPKDDAALALKVERWHQTECWIKMQEVRDSRDGARDATSNTWENLPFTRSCSVKVFYCGIIYLLAFSWYTVHDKNFHFNHLSVYFNGIKYTYITMQLSPLSILRTFFIIPNSISNKQYSPFSSSPNSWEPLLYFLSLCILLCVFCSHKWNHAIFVPLWLASFT